MRTAQNILKHELIGLRANIAKSRNQMNSKIQGKIVDETQHTIVLVDSGKEKRVFKKCVDLEINIDGKNILISGKDLEGRPWDRIKK
jgi:ribonuclease P protein subunit POP4